MGLLPAVAVLAQRLVAFEAKGDGCGLLGIEFMYLSESSNSLGL
jgi:hypothetical protein